MKKKIGELNGKPIIVGDENSLTKNEILLEGSNENITAMKVRQDGEVQTITPQGGSKPIVFKVSCLGTVGSKIGYTKTNAILSAIVSKLFVYHNDLYGDEVCLSTGLLYCKDYAENEVVFPVYSTTYYALTNNYNLTGGTYAIKTDSVTYLSNIKCTYTYISSEGVATDYITYDSNDPDSWVELSEADKEKLLNGEEITISIYAGSTDRAIAAKLSIVDEPFA